MPAGQPCAPAAVGRAGAAASCTDEWRRGRARAQLAAPAAAAAAAAATRCSSSSKNSASVVRTRPGSSQILVPAAAMACTHRDHELAIAPCKPAAQLTSSEPDPSAACAPNWEIGFSLPSPFPMRRQGTILRWAQPTCTSPSSEPYSLTATPASLRWAATLQHSRGWGGWRASRWLLRSAESGCMHGVWRGRTGEGAPPQRVADTMQCVHAEVLLARSLGRDLAWVNIQRGSLSSHHAVRDLLHSRE